MQQQTPTKIFNRLPLSSSRTQYIAISAFKSESPLPASLPFCHSLIFRLSDQYRLSDLYLPDGYLKKISSSEVSFSLSLLPLLYLRLPSRPPVEICGNIEIQRTSLGVSFPVRITSLRDLVACLLE